MIEPGPSARFFQQVQRNGIHFLFPRTGTQTYWSSCLADGLDELRVPIFANLNEHPRLEGRHPWLFPQTSRPPAAAAIIVGDVSDIEQTASECDKIIRSVLAHPRQGILLCMADVANSTDFPATAIVFVAHEITRIQRSGRRVPWAFGLNRDVLRKINIADATATDRKPVFLRNFRPSLNQCVRQSLDLAFVKPLSQHFEIDQNFAGDRHFSETYYAKLANALGCLAYGGTFAEDLSRHPWLRAHGYATRWIIGDDPIIIRWDSWRFWESLASGCLTIMLDFDEYGLRLPVIPENGKHYVGLRFDLLDGAIKALTGDRERLAQIAAEGKHWAITHYAPVPTALRFLRIFEELNGAG